MKLSATVLGVLFLLCSNTLFSQNEDWLFSPKGVGEIRITLADGKKIGDIKNEKNDNDYAGKLLGTMQVRNSGSSEYVTEDFYNGKIKIEGRGNTTWGVPKRPYNIDLVGDDEITEIESPLLGMPAAEEWSLLAFWHDRSLMRIPMAMYLGQHMSGIKWSPRMRYVELWINNEYRGLYLLSEKIQRANDRIDIKKLTDAPEDQVEPRVSGGYILEGSTEGKLSAIEKSVQFKTERDNINFTFKYPKPKNVTPEQRAWIWNYINTFENVLRSDNFKDPVNGYQKYIDVESFIDWTILHEQSRGVDNLFHASTFVHKDRAGKLNMSAPWDFDLSYGNAGSPDADSRQETGNMVRTHRWFDRLSRDPAYMARYKARLDELAPLFNQIPAILNANYEQLNESGAIRREEEKWPQILWEFQGETDMETPFEHKAHVRILSDWVTARTAWCYVAVGADDDEKGERLGRTKPVIRIMDPEAMEEEGRFSVKVMKGYKYSWNDGNEITDNVKRISAKGKYWVRVLDSHGYTSPASDTLYYKVEPPAPPTGIAVPKANSFTYNNPVSDELQIAYNASNDFSMSVQLFDLKGIRVKNAGVFVTPGNNRIQIPVSGLENGMYILQLGTENGIVAKKIIVSQ
jgi:hypothetical protein